ncbi:Gfo/Idh/MocA family protein [Planctomicrobium sp. SH661]|uniref:Gfo/Idh/MocA family protein n=1 Tax=Planctomicrobium sp. SH661 TaxID=3448124 RepID=UPI003F5B85A3
MSFRFSLKAFFCLIAAQLYFPQAGIGIAEDKVIRVGLIGTDTSHSQAFTKSLNASPAKLGMEGVRVVAAFPGGSSDMPISINYAKKNAEQLSEFGVQVADSIGSLLNQVDVVIINSIDGRIHLEQAKEVILAGRPVFIDKPLAASLSDGKAIFELAKQKNVPCFSSSSLRYATQVVQWKEQEKIFGCDAYSPCSTEPHHPTLFWYGIHGVETLYAVMGPGCESVTSTHTDEQDVVVGRWKDGRIGTFRGTRLPKNKGGFGCMVYGSDKFIGGPVGVNYDLLLIEIVKFFKTGISPVPPEETLEILAFMEAADQSHENGGCSVKLETLPR